MSQTRVIILNEVKKGEPGDWQLCFQWCRYEYGEGGEETGYRFIWRRPNGDLQGARGQARIPSVPDILELTSIAIKEGWGQNFGPGSGKAILKTS